MIVRDFLANPTPNNFDYFNDYTNTYNWLHMIPQSKERDQAIKILKDGYDEWIKK